MYNYKYLTYWQNSINKDHEWKKFYIVCKKEEKRKGNNLLTFNSTK